MTERERKTCRTCGRMIAVSAEQEIIARHKDQRREGWPLCPASGTIWRY